MSGLMTGFHPSFDALSSHADRTDVEAARTRVARHVARCAQCRAEVSEIRALGDAARAVRPPSAPASLRARIEDAAPAMKEPVLDVPVPSLAPSRSARRHALPSIAAGLLLAVIASAVLWPRPNLQAAGPSRLTFFPARPVPGDVVTLRYVPSPTMKDASRLVVVGRYGRPAGEGAPRYFWRAFDAVADSVGVLLRMDDGTFAGTVQLPADLLALSLSVRASNADRVDFDGASPWILIGGTRMHEPSLASLLAAQEMRVGLTDVARRPPRQAVDVADSLKRYFSRHPAGWAYTHSYGFSRGRFDFARFFTGAERKYASMAQALSAQPALDAERLHDMVVFANNIDEPSEQLRWAARLADEHPEDTRALFDLAGALHAVELQEPPAFGDSVRRRLPALDLAYRRAPVPNAGYEEARRLAIRYGDSTTGALWISRGAANAAIGSMWLLAQRAAEAGGDGASSVLHQHAVQPCTLPNGRYPLLASVGEWRARCELFRGIAFSVLSSLTLRSGHARSALFQADSAIVSMRRAEWCVASRGHEARAFAELALGDTAAAAADFIRASVTYPDGATPLLDTARARLGPHFDRAAAAVRLDSLQRAVRACQDSLRPIRQARQRERPQ